jgi:hypothetical protein
MSSAALRRLADVAWLARFFADRRLVFQRDSEGRPVPRPSPEGITPP